MFETQWNLLTNAAKAGKLPHALLFYGQNKIGKKDFAVKFAKSLVGEKEPNPDLIIVEPENKDIQIKQIRDLIEKLSFKAYSADYKIAILNEAHLMNKEAQNCFLKFLEEPTEKTHLILIASFSQTLLPTILSRVQKLRFYSLSNPEYKKEYIEDLNKLFKSNLAERFNYAKMKEEENLEEIFENWVSYLREILLKDCSVKIKNTIESIQKAKLLVTSTNVNRKLIMEVLLMSL